jgi:hypothetical protein
MRTVRRLRKDESGMTMGLALIMIVLLGTMGAGLLTFASGDLNAVLEVNRAQRAFELADAGVGAAKRQLTLDCGSDPNCEVRYNDFTVYVDDVRWSKFYTGGGGVTLTNLDGSATTSDSVLVTIEYRPATDDFKVISTGTYGDAKRKIEAILKGVISFGGAGEMGHPLYYTPSDIKIEATADNPVLFREISLFSGGDILIQGLTRSDFITEMGGANNAGILTTTGKSDTLQDWCTTKICNTKAFQNMWGPWNTQEREENKAIYTKHKTGDDLLDPGMVAEGKICGFDATDTATGTCDLTGPYSQSIADGVYGYDCTTGPVDLEDTVCLDPPDPRGNLKTFVDKQPEYLSPNPDNTITYPFPRPEPVPASLKENAHATWTCDPASSTCSPPFTDLVGNRNDIVFIEANGSTVNFQTDNNPNLQGVLVVWCGRLVQQAKFQGIIMNLNGDGTEFGSANCEGDGTKGTYRNEGQDFSGWLYAEGGTDQMAGIELGPNSKMGKFPGGNWSFDMNAFQNAPPNSFALQGWRELYD